MQGLGEQITPLVTSSLEMIGKIVIAFHAGSDAWVYRRYCGGTIGMVYYGDSVDYQNLPDACTS